GDHQAFERHLLADLVKAGAQGAELFRPHAAVVFLEEEHGALIRSPSGLGAAGEKGFVIEPGSHGGPRGGRRWRGGRKALAQGFVLEFGLVEGGLDVGPRGGCSFLLGAFQSVMDAAHSFLSFGTSWGSDWRSRSARVARVRKASTRSNFSEGGTGAIMAAEALPSDKSKSRATESAISAETVFFLSTKALTRQCSQSRLMMRGMPSE